MMLNFAFVFLVSIIASGCASRTLTVTYQSDPPGAVLYEDETGTRFGYMPYVVNYQVTDLNRNQGRMLLKGTSAKWISGASATYREINIDLNQYGYNQIVTFRRPNDFSGREIDERFAFDMQNQRAQQQQQQYEQQVQNTNEKQMQQINFEYQLCMNRAQNQNDVTNCFITKNATGSGMAIGNALGGALGR